MHQTRRRVLLYQGLHGGISGEDAMCQRWAELLGKYCDLTPWIEPPRSSSKSLSAKLEAQVAEIWNREAMRRFNDKLESVKPDLVVFGNFNGLSPAAVHATQRKRVKSVVLLHNYRPVCGTGLLYRDGHPCSLCAEVHWTAATWTRCIRGSAAKSIMPAVKTVFHRWLSTYERASLLVSPSGFLVDKLQSLGLRSPRYFVMPNWVDPPELAKLPPLSQRQDFLFAGILSRHKGILELANSWQSTRLKDSHRLVIVGDGPLTDELRALSDVTPSIVLLGTRNQHELRLLMRQSLAVVVPSLWPEPFGLVAVEALSTATPILTTKSGALVEINRGKVGELIDAPSAIALESSWSAISSDWATFSTNALKRYEAAYSTLRAEENLSRMLTAVFKDA